VASVAAVPSILRRPIIGGLLGLNMPEVFGKRHDHVVRDIRSLIDANPSWGVSNFGDTPYVEPTNGQPFRQSPPIGGHLSKPWPIWRSITFLTVAPLMVY
jgi:hypothetical protein